MGVALVGEIEAFGGKLRGARRNSVPGTFEYNGLAPDVAEISELAGAGGSAILGKLGPTVGHFELAEGLLESDIHVMIYDVSCCTSREWDDLGKVALKQRRRLVCGQQLIRFNPLIANLYRKYNNATSSIMALYSGVHDGDAVSLLAPTADVAMLPFDSKPSAVFAACMAGKEGSAPHSASAFLRFAHGRSAFISSAIEPNSHGSTAPGAIVRITAHGISRSLQRDLEVRNDLSVIPEGPPLTGSELESPDAALVLFSNILNYLAGVTVVRTRNTLTPEDIQRPETCAFLARTMEAIAVSINTGAPVYIN